MFSFTFLPRALPGLKTTVKNLSTKAIKPGISINNRVDSEHIYCIKWDYYL